MKTVLLYLLYYEVFEILSAYTVSKVGNYDTEDSDVIHSVYFRVEEVYSVFLVNLHEFMLPYEKVCGTMFFNQNE